MPVKKYKTKKQKQKAYVKQVNESLKKTTTSFAFRFMNGSDQAIIEKLKSVPNKVDYVRQLILNDIKKSSK